jgi:C1A family cysteine protease
MKDKDGDAMVRMNGRSERAAAAGSPFKRRMLVPATACVVAMVLLLALAAAGVFAAPNTVTGRVASASLSPEFVDIQMNPSMSLPAISANGRAPGLLPSPQDLSFTKGMRVSAAGALMALPSSYDLRTSGRLTPVRDQGSFGTCWAFASLGSLESYLMPGDPNDFSEDNLALTSGFNYPGGSYNAGGQMYMSTAYLTRWGGPVNESEDAYGDSLTPTGLTARKHVQQVDWIPARASATDNDNIKNAVMTNGGLYVTMYWSSTYYRSATAGYYYSGSSGANHAVVIVGWDDNYPAGNFATAPAGNGAFIVRNSWGSGWGSAGYFYVSYYDGTFGRLDPMANFDSVGPATNYSAVYQYDPLGDVNGLGYGTSTAWFANVFTAQSTNSISAVGFYTLSPSTAYEVYTGPSLSALTLNTSGTMTYMGFHTITLATPQAITSGQPFVVAVKVVSPGTGYPVAVEYAVADYSSAATSAAGQSYISPSGTGWSDITTSYSSTANVCLKAYVGGAPVPPATEPKVTALSPASGVLAGGTEVTVTGLRLSGASAVTFGGVPAASFSVDSDTQITAHAPAGSAAGAVRVQVTTAGGSSADTAADDYTYLAVPAITSISPAGGSTAGGTSVVINGTGFAGVSGANAVKFGVTNAASYTVNSSTKITAVAPAAAAAGPVSVRVAAAGGTTADTSADDYTYTVAPTRYQQNAAGLVYGGTWSTVTISSASGSSYTRSSTSTGSVSFAFNGSSVGLIATKASGMGKANVSIDGGAATVVDLYAATTAYQQLVFTKGGLTQGLHIVKITWNSTNASGKYVNLDAVDIVGTIPTATHVDQSDAHLIWNGTWSTLTNTSYFGGNAKSINAAGSVTITFSGVSLNVIAAKARAYGRMSVSIDGGAATTVDLYSYSTSYKQTVWSSGLLVSKTHTVKITWLGTRSSSATGTTIDLDGVDVIGTLQ